MQRRAGRFAQRFSICKTGHSHEEFGDASSALDGDLRWFGLNSSYCFDLHFCNLAQFERSVARLDRIGHARPFNLGFGFGCRADQ